MSPLTPSCSGSSVSIWGGLGQTLADRSSLGDESRTRTRADRSGRWCPVRSTCSPSTEGAVQGATRTQDRGKGWGPPRTSFRGVWTSYGPYESDPVRVGTEETGREGPQGQVSDGLETRPYGDQTDVLRRSWGTKRVRGELDWTLTGGVGEGRSRGRSDPKRDVTSNPWENLYFRLVQEQTVVGTSRVTQ